MYLKSSAMLKWFETDACLGYFSHPDILWDFDHVCSFTTKPKTKKKIFIWECDIARVEFLGYISSCWKKKKKTLDVLERTRLSLILVKVAQSCLTLQPHGPHSPRNSPGQNTGVGICSLLQEIFPTQGLNPGLPHCGWILYQLSHKGSPRILEWVAYPFSSGSSWPKESNWVLHDYNF